MNTDYILSIQNISKSFPGVQALDDVQLHVEKGKVHALMGENGAGKSTLMKILIGMRILMFSNAPTFQRKMLYCLICTYSQLILWKNFTVQ